MATGHDRDARVRAGAPRPVRRHCWVHYGEIRSPGLVLEWRRDAGGWWARVVLVPPSGPSSAADMAVEAWVRAEQVHPA